MLGRFLIENKLGLRSYWWIDTSGRTTPRHLAPPGMFTQETWHSSLITAGGITEGPAVGTGGGDGADDGSRRTNVTSAGGHWGVSLWMDNCRNVRSGLATQTTARRVDIGRCEYALGAGGVGSRATSAQMSLCPWLEDTTDGGFEPLLSLRCPPSQHQCDCNSRWGRGAGCADVEALFRNGTKEKAVLAVDATSWVGMEFDMGFHDCPESACMVFNAYDPMIDQVPADFPSAYVTAAGGGEVGGYLINHGVVGGVILFRQGRRPRRG